MSVDNTHLKYLRGKDKKAWSGYKEALETQNKLEDFLGGLKAPDLKPGEEYEIPIVKQNKTKKQKKQ